MRSWHQLQVSLVHDGSKDHQWLTKMVPLWHPFQNNLLVTSTETHIIQTCTLYKNTNTHPHSVHTFINTHKGFLRPCLIDLLRIVFHLAIISSIIARSIITYHKYLFQHLHLRPYLTWIESQCLFLNSCLRGRCGANLLCLNRKWLLIFLITPTLKKKKQCDVQKVYVVSEKT